MNDEDDNSIPECDTYFYLFTNNIELNANYLNGSKLVVSNEQTLENVESKPILEGSSINTHDLIIYLNFFKCSMKSGDTFRHVGFGITKSQ